MSKRITSRRDFLKAAGITLAAVTVTCSGLGYAATRPPASNMNDSFFGKDNPMKDRILVTYATRAGSTVEVAAAIGETLAQRGYAVEVKAVKDKPALDGYQAVVLGSAIRMGNWLPEMKEFIKQNQATLAELPVGIFTVHMLNAGEDEASRSARMAYTAPVHALLSPVAETFFQGKIDYATLSFLDRMLAKAVEKQTGTPPGDYRNWDEINAWAESVFDKGCLS